ncbi:uncharacterized protein LOC106650959 [Trichogramma pretiosum]|uniref:uncharacterized protein LOC106650959 n=1 Tax=Trichogramma pretiosum TaxID=7493 RepID=UPI0006C9B6DD|nr:uncharacterized protein LOC106650959 [Trichogramma pretiosum]XP_014224758.1 uncharacterized protein LOC106650959 [Trichogramma pretiosum]
MIRNRKIVCLRINGQGKFLKKKSILSHSKTYKLIRMNFYFTQKTNHDQLTTKREEIHFQRSEYDIHQEHGYDPSKNCLLDKLKYFPAAVCLHRNNKHLKLHLHSSAWSSRPNTYLLNQVRVLLMLTELITDKNLEKKLTVSYHLKLKKINLKLKDKRKYALLHFYLHVLCLKHKSIKLSTPFLFHNLSDPLICLKELCLKRFCKFDIKKSFKNFLRKLRLLKLRYSKMLHNTKEANADLPKKTYLCPPCDINFDISSLFFHIRQVHHRFLCLHCLEMFNRAETLLHHLSKNHNISESDFFTAKDLLNSLSDEFSIICCTCENIFTKNEEFNEHFCECTMNFPDECLQLEEIKISEKSWDSLDNISIDRLNDATKPNEMSYLKHDFSVEPSTSSESLENISKYQSSENILTKLDKLSENKQYETAAGVKSKIQLNLSPGADMDEKTAIRTDSKLEAKPNEDQNDVGHLRLKELNIDSYKLSELNRNQTLDQKHSDNLNNSKNNSQKAIAVLHDFTKSNEDFYSQFDSATKIVERSKSIDVDNSTEFKSSSILKNKDSLENVEAWKNIYDSIDNSPIDSNYNGDQFNLENISTFDVDQLNDVASNLNIKIKIDLEIENLLENIKLDDLMRYCVKAAYDFCTYCNHVRLIAVNGKQLGLHLLTNHEFQFESTSNTSEQHLLITKLKECSDTLDKYYLNFDSSKAETGIHKFLDLKYYECFICRYKSISHKDLCSHNRKIHQKLIFKCSMCNTGFNSYSELICHLCSGFAVNYENIYFRCCYCSITGLPSAFRLMVHLRKRHNACDICLKIISDQQTLSNHIWKHKLPHSCYKCGISYKHKSDIVKHLFWKHGTESVSCQKCLQKKWPYIYHFCTPPNDFVCDDCGVSFTKAVALKVHKRIHEKKFPHACLVCQMTFISKKLLSKHAETHKITPVVSTKVEIFDTANKHFDDSHTKKLNSNKCKKLRQRKKKDSTDSVGKAIDIANIPPLNLSSDSDNETDDKRITDADNKTLNIGTNLCFKDSIHSSFLPSVSETMKNLSDEKITEEEKKQEEQLMDSIWSNFKTYTESLEKQNIFQQDDVNYLSTSTVSFSLIDHDYCSTPIIDQNIPHKFSFDSKEKAIVDTDSTKEKLACEVPDSVNESSTICENPLNILSSNSSPSNNSCSCSCVSDCSCSSSSSSDTSSIASISNRSPVHRNYDMIESENMIVTEVVETEKNITIETTPDLSKTVHSESINQSIITSQSIAESDLFTSESDTDEDFYEKIPESCYLDSKVSKSISNSDNGSKNANSINLKKKNNLNIILKKNKTTKACYFIPESKSSSNEVRSGLQIQSEMMKESKVLPDIICNNSTISNPLKILLPAEKKSKKRFSVRRRIPKRFYGDSSDEEDHKTKLKKFKTSSSISVYESQLNSSFVSDREVLENDEVNNELNTTKDSYRESKLFKFDPPEISNNMKIKKPFIRTRNLQMKKDKHTNYCYCRCAYDESSEMIACDSGVCSIEWFHFKCVGITTPPEGAWYCFDCNKLTYE